MEAERGGGERGTQQRRPRQKPHSGLAAAPRARAGRQRDGGPTPHTATRYGAAAGRGQAVLSPLPRPLGEARRSWPRPERSPLSGRTGNPLGEPGGEREKPEPPRTAARRGHHNPAAAPAPAGRASRICLLAASLSLRRLPQRRHRHGTHRAELCPHRCPPDRAVAPPRQSAPGLHAAPPRGAAFRQSPRTTRGRRSTAVAAGGPQARGMGAAGPPLGPIGTAWAGRAAAAASAPVRAVPYRTDWRGQSDKTGLGWVELV